jgi:hypothetical protein
MFDRILTSFPVRAVSDVLSGLGYRGEFETRTGRAATSYVDGRQASTLCHFLCFFIVIGAKPITDPSFRLFVLD